MRDIKITILLFLTFGFIACNSNVKKENNKKEIVETKLNSQKYFSKIWQNFPLKSTPLIDTTNFDNIKEIKEFNTEEIKILKLNKVYPEIEKESSNFKVYPSYKLELSDQYYTLILNIYKGEHELESVLVNYSKDEKITSYKVISYDEIAEGWSRKHSEINNNVITIIDEFYGDNKKINTTKFHINRNGEINQIKTKFNSNLKPEKLILLNQIYTDTIEFLAYNDDGDYSLLSGKKNGIDISIVYNWERYNNEKYNFIYGDIIKIKWKMDSIFYAGNGETLDFKETGIDAERVIPDNKQVQFLWRAEKFDEKLNQSFNSIFINKPFSNSISNQEKAALGYVATFIGNECWWDGKANENRSNLKCEILTALDLGYQCSDKHLNFLRKWFSKDAVALKKLESCRTMPYTATVQTTFDEITIFTDKDNKIITVNYKVLGMNIRESKNWSWAQTDTFKYDLENITLINSQKSELTKENIEINEK